MVAFGPFRGFTEGGGDLEQSVQAAPAPAPHPEAKGSFEAAPDA